MTRIYQKLVDACFECPNCIRNRYSTTYFCEENDDLIINPYDVLDWCPLKSVEDGDDIE